METRLNLNLHQDAFNKTLEEDMHGFLTKPAFRSSTGIATLLTPISLLNPVTTLSFGCIGSLTFNIALIPLFAIAIILGLFLLGSSWLWIKAPVLRIFLFFPGILIAPIATRYVGLLPFQGKVDIRLAAINICMIWPLSFSLYRRTVDR